MKILLLLRLRTAVVHSRSDSRIFPLDTMRRVIILLIRTFNIQNIRCNTILLFILLQQIIVVVTSGTIVVLVPCCALNFKTAQACSVVTEILFYFQEDAGLKKQTRTGRMTIMM